MVKKAVNGVYGNLHKGTPSATDFSCVQVMGSTEASLVNQEWHRSQVHNTPLSEKMYECHVAVYTHMTGMSVWRAS